MVLHLHNPAAGRIDSTQYRLGGAKEGWYPTGESSSPAVLSCMFAWTRELLFTMTQAHVQARCPPFRPPPHPIPPPGAPQVTPQAPLASPKRPRR